MGVTHDSHYWYLMKLFPMLLAGALYFILVGFSSGQPEQSVTWHFRVETDSNMEARLISTAQLAPGWHLYSQFLSAGGPMPTHFTFALTSGYALVEGTEEHGKPITYHDSIYEMTITKYEGAVVFRQQINLLRSSVVVKGFVEYMTCNNSVCVPGKKEFSISIEAPK